MIKAVGVEFKENGEKYYFSTKKVTPKKNITVIVDTEKGIQFGKVVTDVIDIDEKLFTKEIKPIIRISTKKDFNIHKKNLKDAKEALIVCKKIVEEDNLKMQVIDATYSFDRSQLLFRFVADNRIDFRDLAKELAAIYKTRIELRQIGIRDKAKEVGGLGICGRKMCCARFLKDFNSVSISMAKNQNLSLNPSKINGVCGRLLCCLKYEDDNYTECKKNLPKIGEIVKTEKGEGKVISLDILNHKYVVELNNHSTLEINIDSEKKDETNS